MAPVLGYWNFRGFAQPIRFMLTYVGQKFEDTYYSIGPAPNFDMSSWFDVKLSLPLDFPNLPYYIDGDVKLTQSVAIMKYLADVHNLNPTTQEEKNRVYMAEGEILDLRSQYVKVIMAYFKVNHVNHKQREQVKEEYLKGLPSKLKSVSDFLGHRKWLAGKTLTYVDFLFYEVLDHQRKLQKDCLKEFVNLTNYMKHFEALPNIGEYMKTDKFKNLPMNSLSTNFGATV